MSKTIGDHFGLTFQENSPIKDSKQLLFGIEREIEAVASWKYTEESLNFWNKTEDGSLRNNGAEFISVPCTQQEACNMFVQLNKELVLGNNPYSDRTSIHVHVNCVPLSPVQVRNILLLYALLEEFFFDMVHPDRKENIHCVMLADTMVSQYYKATLSVLVEKWGKYSALNLKPLSEQGTVEFRHMHGHGDPILFNNWLSMISRLFSVGTNLVVNKAFLTDIRQILSVASFVADRNISLNELEQKTSQSLIDLKLAMV